MVNPIDLEDINYSVYDILILGGVEKILWYFLKTHPSQKQIKTAYTYQLESNSAILKIWNYFFFKLQKSKS